MSSTPGPWYEPYHRLLRGLAELSAHIAMLLAILGGIKIVEMVVHKFWGKDYLFFDWLKLRYIFDGADLLILVGFLIWGVYSILGAFIRKPSKNE